MGLPSIDVPIVCTSAMAGQRVWMLFIAAVTSVMFLKCVKSICAVSGGAANRPSRVAIRVARMISSGELDDGESGGAQPVDLHVQRLAIDGESSGTIGNGEDVDLVVRDSLHVVLARHYNANEPRPWLVWSDRLEHVPRGHQPAQLAEFAGDDPRSEEHTSELQSRVDLVCRLLLEKKKRKYTTK